MTERNIWALLEDESFIRWVLHPNEELNAIWASWMAQDPERATWAAQARDYVVEIQQSSSNGRVLPEPRAKALSEQIWLNIRKELHGMPAREIPVRENPVREIAAMEIPMPRNSFRWWVAAASLTLLAGSGAALWYAGRTSPDAPQAAVLKTIRQPGNSLIEYTNHTSLAQKVYLVDGSVVTVAPGSTLSYERFLDRKNREVSLQGSAFFDIAKDPNHPFLVRSGDIVTRVLGTSFRVTAEPGKEEIHVAVRTGKVSVYKQADFDNGEQAFCVLLPHQEAVFHRKSQNLAFVPNADEQLLIPPPIETVSMDFDDVPVTTILEELGKMYHIHIEYNKDSLQQCRLTTSLQEEKLTEKLDIICKAINASYHTEEENIVIDGGHCQ